MRLVRELALDRSGRGLPPPCPRQLNTVEALPVTPFLPAACQPEEAGRAMRSKCRTACGYSPGRFTPAGPVDSGRAEPEL